MDLDVSVTVRMNRAQRDQLRDIAARMNDARGSKIGHAISVGDVVRMAVDDYLRRNG